MRRLRLRDDYEFNEDDVSYDFSEKEEVRMIFQLNTVPALKGRSGKIDAYRIYDNQGKVALDVDITILKHIK